MPLERTKTYRPAPVPMNFDSELLPWLQREFHQLRDALNLINERIDALEARVEALEP